ncbi:glycosyltransferase family 4 protein [Skermanella mucosa]|uniref:glycosyltransferase family 4 protein n=1 Tax=Skermanella mucosa TaxID=1789672 RepID=UPI00192AD628|nr:glycosyltransferase family 1 protein [Skermanella mucosa]UEM22291.1 glycosyltransferase family 4 protein [Skermanella mucosa]
MRIVLDLQACQSPSRLRGIGRYSLELAKAMARSPRGHEILIAMNGALDQTVEPIRQAFDGLMPWENMPVWSQPTGVSFLTGESRWRIEAAERIRERFLQGLRPDVVHVSSLFEGLYHDVTTSVAGAVPGLPTAVTLYDLIPLAHPEVLPDDPRSSEWYARKLMSLRRADMLLAISDHSAREASEMLGIGGDRIRTIHSAADPRFRPADAAEARRDGGKALLKRLNITRPFVLFVGTVDPHKNLAGLLQAYARLPRDLRKSHQLVLVCVVNPPDRIRVPIMAREAGLSDSDYVLTGQLSDIDLVELYRECRLFVCPSFREGFGLPALEAMACGTPAITSNTTSFPEVVGRADAMFDPHSPDSISARMAAVLGDPGLLADLARHGRERAGRYSWEATADKAFDALEELHARHSCPTSGPAAWPAHAARRPRLALVGPLPPERSSVAAWSASLAAELVRHYDVECVAARGEILPPVTAAGTPVRTVEWFTANAAEFDRVVYAIGDDRACLPWMLDLLRRVTGTVVLYDGGIRRTLADLEAETGEPFLLREVYLSHGWTAAVEVARSADREEACGRYPCLEGIAAAAAGIVSRAGDAHPRAGSETWSPADLIDLGPDATPARFVEAIETWGRHARLSILRDLAEDIVAIPSPEPPGTAAWETVLRCAAENLPSGGGLRQILVDVSEVGLRDAGTGIQRVAKNILIELLKNPPAGFRVEPVLDDGSGTLRYARGFAARIMGVPDLGLPEDLVDARNGDVFIGLDLTSHLVEGRAALNRSLKSRGIRSYFVVYDLLPLIQPDWFVPFHHFRIWVQQIAIHCEGLICISRSVADQLFDWLPRLDVQRDTPLRIGHFHLGADIGTTAAGTTAGEPGPEVARVLSSRHPVFLTVGTVEPRKGHAQALAAFEQLWSEGVEAELVIVGKQGWKVEALVEKLRGHPEAGRRLHWFAGASDADLNALYGGCSALLAVSLDEGFGLPLIEAAKHAQPILARDLPVFREIAGDHASYFSGTSPRDLADALRRWMRDQKAGKVRGTAEMPWLTWEQSARRFTEVIFGDLWDATYHADREGSDRRQPFAGANSEAPAEAAEAARAAEPVAAGSD